MATQQTAKTQYIEANGNLLAYRRLGKPSGVPLAMLQHFRGTMDHWDPAIINQLATQRPIILLDNSGVGKSSGEVPTTFAGWAENVIALLAALDIKQIDLLGFSMGGFAAQMAALNAPDLVRRLILTGTGPSVNANTVQGDLSLFLRLAHAVTPEESEAAMADAFYYPTADGKAAAKASWERIHERQEGRSDFLGEEGTNRQIAAFQNWSSPNPTNSFERLHELKMPVFVANGDNDVLLNTANTWELFQNIEGARLALYPAAGHGFLHQYAETFAGHVNDFLG